jgi:hypothetical protein
MLQPSEYRIGNLISVNGKWGKVVYLSELDMYKQVRTNNADPITNLQSSDNAEPVRLNDYFERYYPNQTHVSFPTQHRVFEVVKYPSINDQTWQVSEGGKAINIIVFVHNLQNLIHATAFEEINVYEDEIVPQVQ